MQDGQTIGISIGPETSHILTEIISVAIDVKLQEVLSLDERNAMRYVDDRIIAMRDNFCEPTITYEISRGL
jgi:hypothetical protein